MVRAVALDHVVLVVSDVETTLAWYQQHLGLDGERVDQWRAGAIPFPSLRVDEGTVIDLLAGEPDGRGHIDHLCFVVSRADIRTIKDEGKLHIFSEGERWGARGVAHSIYVHDPDGLLVELRAYA